MSSRRWAGLAVLLLVVGTRPAWADATAFLGATTTPDNRQTRGFAVGIELVALAVEFEYASSVEDASNAAPSLRSGMGNVILQAPFAIFGIVPYATAGAGVYREVLDGVAAQTGFGLNTGAGLKVSMVGPLRLRVDYRVFRLGSGALYSPAHRVYAGLNLRF